ncbi:MAG: ATP-dependent RNA helicase HrpA [Gammaproteobacteria bacterium]|nr:MAG: ATP-dependent RNA helicase HrpA [Gammaproteobacteria bacterium]
MTHLQPPSLAELNACLLSDRQVLHQRLRSLRQRLKRGQPINQGLAPLRQAIAASQALVAHRRLLIPEIHYPSELPVSERRQEVAALIARHQVVVLCGETGSGKSTQLPKICLELGRGIFGRIGHTQPRRIAARTLASRVAQELGGESGGLVGYKVRFHDRVRPETCIKLMTDGILLAEIQQDRYLNEYDTLIIDEAHERGLNIDFLLGYLRKLLPRRPELKVVVISATIEPQRFANHFADGEGRPAPIIEISGRTYPVEVRYRPPEEENAGERDEAMQLAISAAVDELAKAGRGDILVFLSGEREIRETAETLRKHHPPSTEILPLYARQSPAEQARVFQAHGTRRVVLATNVAETSLTVPGIHYVIDPGFARISRYSHRGKVQRLPVERVSQASANQRQGRCGRVAAGICIRLYAEDNFQSRTAYTEPEIQRANLAAVILQMKLLGFGDIAAFPFIDPPDPRLVADGYRTLEELAALDPQGELTSLGRQLARLPLDPRIGRMLLAAADLGCLSEMLVIASALSVQDPRERPLEQRQAADEIHATFNHPESDFLSFLHLWHFLEKERAHLTKSKFRQLCQRHFLSWNRVTEWRDVHAQLHAQMAEMGFRVQQPAGRDAGTGPGSPVRPDSRPPLPNPPPTGVRGQEQHYAALHLALLAGLLGNIGCKDEGREYQGARNSRFLIHPSSGLFDQQPKWIVAAERVETSRQYGRIVARVQPAWIEEAGRHLLQRTYFEPHWQAASGQVAAFEKVTLFGVTLVPKRRVNYGPINPAEARAIFIRFALTEGDFDSRAPFWRHNRELIAYLQHLEAKSRRRDILVDEDAIHAFYDQRVPPGIYSTPLFERWLRQATQKDPKLLHLRMEDAMRHEAAGVTAQAFPDSLQVGATALPLEYRFDPGEADDGLTLVVPAPLINQVSPDRCAWLVPGLLPELIAALLRGLPKAWRKLLVPIPDTAERLAGRLKPADRSLIQALGEEIRALTGHQIPEDAWDPAVVPAHLRMKFRLVDEGGQPLAAGEDYADLKRRFGGSGRQAFAAIPSQGLEREGITRWDFGELPESVDLDRAGIKLRGYPALVDQGDSVALRVLDSPEGAELAQRAGLRRLFMLSLAVEVRQLRRNLPGLDRLRLQYAKAPALGSAPSSVPASGAASGAALGSMSGAALGSMSGAAPRSAAGSKRGSASAVGKVPANGPAEPQPQPMDLADEVLALIIDLTFVEDLPPIRDRAAFEARLASRRARLSPVATEVLALVGRILDDYQALRQGLAGITQVNWMSSVLDLRAQLDGLIFRGFLLAVPYARLKDYPRYLKAARERLDKLFHAAGRDQQHLRELTPLLDKWRERAAAVQALGRRDPRLEEIRWMLEELRISFFAQRVGTAYPVSLKRIEARWKELGL